MVQWTFCKHHLRTKQWNSLGWSATHLVPTINFHKRKYKNVFCRFKSNVSGFRFNVCRLEFEKRSNLLITLFIENTKKDNDFSFMKCFLSSGQYIFRRCQKTPLKTTNLPSFLPFHIKVIIQFSITAKVNKKVKVLYSASEVIEIS